MCVYMYVCMCVCVYVFVVCVCVCMCVYMCVCMCTVQLNKKLSLPRTNYRPQGTLQGTSPQYRVLRFTSGTGQWVVRGTL